LLRNQFHYRKAFAEKYHIRSKLALPAAWAAGAAGTLVGEPGLAIALATAAFAAPRRPLVCV